MARQFIYHMQGLSKSYAGGKKVLDNIHLSFYPDAKIGVLGPNGSGKSTLLRIMAGIDKEWNGEAWLADGARCGYLEQEPQLDPTKSVFENVMEGVAAKKAILDEYNALMMDYNDENADKAAKLQDVIDAQNLWDLDSQVEQAMDALRCPPSDADVTKLSGGERRRVALTRLLLSKPDLLLLDEPTNHLDAESVNWLEHHLREYPGAILIVTHDRYFLDNVTGWILELDRGRGIPYEGNYSAYLTQKAKRFAQEAREDAARQKVLERESEWMGKSPQARQAKREHRVRAGLGDSADDADATIGEQHDRAGGVARRVHDRQVGIVQFHRRAVHQVGRQELRMRRSGVERDRDVVIRRRRIAGNRDAGRRLAGVREGTEGDRIALADGEWRCGPGPLDQERRARHREQGRIHRHEDGAKLLSDAEIAPARHGTAVARIRQRRIVVGRLHRAHLEFHRVGQRREAVELEQSDVDPRLVAGGRLRCDHLVHAEIDLGEGRGGGQGGQADCGQPLCCVTRFHERVSRTVARTCAGAPLDIDSPAARDFESKESKSRGSGIGAIGTGHASRQDARRTGRHDRVKPPDRIYRDRPTPTSPVQVMRCHGRIGARRGCRRERAAVNAVPTGGACRVG